MRRFFTTLLSLSVLSGSSFAITSCPAFFTDPNRIYQGPDDQLLNIGMFPSAAFKPKADTIPYVQRLIRAVERRGTQLVVVSAPQPGPSFIGKLDRQAIKGTRFEGVNAKTEQYFRDLYAATFDYIKAAGADVVDLQGAFYDFSRTNPAPLWFKHDGHWTPTAARVAAHATQTLLSSVHPGPLGEMHAGTFKVVSTPATRTSVWSWDGLIKQVCPQHEPLEEPFVNLKLERVGAADADALLSDTPPMVLVGTSFSSARGKFGYDLFLSEFTGAIIDNRALDGGNATGSLFEYYATRKAGDAEPSLMVWEVPTHHLLEVDNSLGFSINGLRQVLPVIERTARRLGERSASVAAENSIDVAALRASGDNHYLKLSFDQLKTRRVTATLTYEKGSEVVMLAHPVGLVLNQYFLELKPEMGTLQTVMFKVDEKAVGNARIELFAYTNN